VATFPNLGNNAILVAPCETAGLDFAHFASFIRRAPSEQAHALLAAVGAAVEKRLAEKRASGQGLTLVPVSAQLELFCPQYKP
jgi:hypothetical protein